MTKDDVLEKWLWWMMKIGAGRLPKELEHDGLVYFFQTLVVLDYERALRFKEKFGDTQWFQALDPTKLVKQEEEE